MKRHNREEGSPRVPKVFRAIGGAAGFHAKWRGSMKGDGRQRRHPKIPYLVFCSVFGFFLEIAAELD